MSDLADYCRQVEAHLTRVNGGHLVRVVGPGFSLVRQWAEQGVPLSVVFKGIDQKSERHKLGASRRPLRIEFCEADVLDVFETWRRATGISVAGADAQAGALQQEGLAGSAGVEPRRRTPTRSIDKAIERLGRVAGRLELPDAFRDAVSRAIEQLSLIRDGLVHSRGAARDTWLAQLGPIDQDLLAHARQIVEARVLRELTVQAERDLAAYRDRMTPEAWHRAVAVTVDRGIRTHLGLPTLEE